MKRTQTVPLAIEETYKFFSNPRIVEILTPSSMRFRLVGEKRDSIKTGTVLNYRFHLYRFPIRWRIRIDSAEPPNSFVDVQLKGPFAHWRHNQTFIATGKESTEVKDRFEFGLRFGRIGELAYQMFLKAKIRQLFDYRANKMDMLMHPNPPRPAKVQTNREAAHQSNPEAAPATGEPASKPTRQ